MELTRTTDEIEQRRAALESRLRSAAERAGRDPDAFRIVAVTKTFPIEVVRAAWDAGLGCFGENRVQEALPKVAALPDADWHLVGHLQSNKVRRAIGAFSMIHSVDSIGLLRRIDAVAHDLDRRPDLLLQVNLAGEASKFGFEAGALDEPELGRVIGELRAARVSGLMTIGPHHQDPRPTFAWLRQLRDALQDRLRTALPELSMGMSADAEAAVAEGATLVRIGTALFGARPA
ncbi:MAG TPA: YggS family pyridoxal phosphate-dependent enzyme [Candidatus Limnocylindria bacterium]|nr:YggS family pyridoxal phosphate-dependent enzyme [Candidatus Limnocylindria bacterium]